MVSLLRVFGCSFVCIGFVRLGSARQCPVLTADWRSTDGGEAISITFTNRAPVTALVNWINFNGETHSDSVHTVNPDASTVIHSFAGHAFRVHGDVTDHPLLLEYQAKKDEHEVLIEGCDGVKAEPKRPFVAARAAEFQSLVHNHTAPCEPAGKSGKWSCVRLTSKEDYAKRLHDGTIFGFADKTESGHRQIGEVWDRGYVSHIGKVPRVADGSGYLKMSFSQKLKDILLPWYAEYGVGGSKTAVQHHPPIPGGYTNSHTVSLSKVDLDDFRHIQRAAAEEMQDIMQWWTGRKLQHTATFGVRIYHRGSMLIDHVDRADTHIASAVIQVAQSVEEDGGWPLEVIDAEGNCAEVFLQPAEFVLYEGGRFRHGRPMRLRGDSMSNVFSHFAPLDWHGPNKSPVYDGRIDEHGHLPEVPEEEDWQKIDL